MLRTCLPNFHCTILPLVSNSGELLTEVLCVFVIQVMHIRSSELWGSTPKLTYLCLHQGCFKCPILKGAEFV